MAVPTFARKQATGAAALLRKETECMTRKCWLSGL